MSTAATTPNDSALAHAAPGRPAVALLDVRKAFAKPVVLDGVSLDIPRGAFLTLLGPSGCGKTTLLRIIAGLELPDAGDVRIAGRSVLTVPAHHRPVNTVFQNYALFGHLDVFENVAFGLRSRRADRSSIADRVRRALELVEAGELARRRPDTLSGGQKQRVALARALVNEPEVLLLDEPMSALDAQLRARVQLELRRLHARLGSTFVLVTHDQDEAMSVSDTVVLMRAGRIEQAGPPGDVYQRPRTRFAAAFLGAANVLPARRLAPGVVETPIGPLRVVADAPPNLAHVCIRPEHIRLLTQGQPQPAAHPNQLQLTITESIFRGDHAELWCSPADLRVRCPSHPRLTPGQRVLGVVEPEHVRTLDD